MSRVPRRLFAEDSTGLVPPFPLPGVDQNCCPWVAQFRWPLTSTPRARGRGIRGALGGVVEPARPSGASGRRCHDDLGRHRRESSRVSSIQSQKAGLGFPICRIVVLLWLAAGALLDAAAGLQEQPLTPPSRFSRISASEAYETKLALCGRLGHKRRRAVVRHLEAGGMYLSDHDLRKFDQAYRAGLSDARAREFLGKRGRI